MKYYYEIKEENVDGCGSDAIEYISSDSMLTQEEQQTLTDCLNTVKQEGIESNEDLDTSDMIHSAMCRFEKKTGKSLEHANNLFSGFITF